MKILSLVLLLVTINTYAQEQVDMSNMRQFNFGKCNGIDGNNIPNLSSSFYTAETCQDAYLQYDVCGIEASTFEKAFESGASIENGKIVKKDIFLKQYKGQCDSWLKVRTRGCRAFVKREATKCGGRSKRSKNNFFNPLNKDRVGLIKTKNILIYSQSETKIEQDRIAAEQERKRLANIEQQRIAAEQERKRLANIEQQRIAAAEQRQAEARRLANAKSSDYRAVCKQEYDDGKRVTNSIYAGSGKTEQICGLIKTYQANIDTMQACIDNNSEKLTRSAINLLKRQVAEFESVIIQNASVGRQLSSSFYCSGASASPSTRATGWGDVLLQGLELYNTYKQNKLNLNSGGSGLYDDGPLR